MTQINELLSSLCPNGVEYKKLGEIGTFTRGSGIQKRDFVEDGKPCIHYGQIYTQYGMAVTKAISSISEKHFAKAKKAVPGDIVIAITSENIEDVCTPLVWEGNTPVAISGHSCAFHTQENPRYIAYCILGERFQQQKTKFAQGTKVIEMKPAELAKAEIPVPPLEVQREIVRIMDSFVKLEAELEAELEARRMQYTYYRDQLLSRENLEKLSDGLVPEIELGKLMAVQRGASPRPIGQYITSDPDGIPWIKIGDVSPKEKYISHTQEKITKSGAEKSRYLEPGSFVLSNSMSFGRPYILQLGGCIHDGWISITHYEKHFSPDFLYHLLNSYPIQKFWDEKASSGTVRNLNSDIVRMTPLLVPPLPVQQRVVDILDRFDALTSSLTDGLPAEIEARRRQYEYYRDRLLDFPRKEADS